MNFKNLDKSHKIQYFVRLRKKNFNCLVFFSSRVDKFVITYTSI